MPPHTLQSKLKHLRSLLITARDLAYVSDYFVEHVVDDPEFVRRGQARANPQLEQVVAGALRACFGSAPLDAASLLVLADECFWHGAAAWLPDGVVLLFYFEDVDVGLLSVARSLADGTVHFIRFSICAPPTAGAYWVKGPRGSC